MNKALLELDNMIDTIKESNEYKTYLVLEQRVQKNEDILNLIDDIKKLQKKLVKLKYQKEKTEIVEKELTDKNTKLNEFLLYIEYIEKQKELNNLFHLIKEELNELFVKNV